MRKVAAVALILLMICPAGCQLHFHLWSKYYDREKQVIETPTTQPSVDPNVVEEILHWPPK